MTNAMTLYPGLLSLLDRGQWRDQRHLKTAVNMLVGLMLSSSISLTGWIPYTLGRALQAQSVQRRFARWLNNERVDVHGLYAPLIQEALSTWGQSKVYLALDTTMLWDQYCLSCLSVIYRGRAVPLPGRWWSTAVSRSPSVSIGIYCGPRRCCLSTRARWCY